MDVAAADARVAHLESLLREVQQARTQVPTLHRALQTVAAPGAWTGTAADTLHRNRLSPLQSELRDSFDRLEEELGAALQGARTTARSAADQARAEADAARSAAQQQAGAW